MYVKRRFGTIVSVLHHMLFHFRMSDSITSRGCKNAANFYYPFGLIQYTLSALVPLDISRQVLPVVGLLFVLAILSTSRIHSARLLQFT